MLTWDEAKRKLNINKHGLDFAECDAIWDHFTVTREDIRQDYGEVRQVCFGLLAGEGSCWFIRSARKARTSSRCERQKSMKHATTAKLPKKTSAKVADPDNPAWTEDMLGAPVFKRGRGPQVTPTKVLTSIRLDVDVLEYFKSQGAGYQSRINETLRKAVNQNLTGRQSPTARKRATA